MHSLKNRGHTEPRREGKRKQQAYQIALLPRNVFKRSRRSVNLEIENVTDSNTENDALIENRASKNRPLQIA